MHMTGGMTTREQSALHTVLCLLQGQWMYVWPSTKNNSALQTCPCHHNTRKSFHLRILMPTAASADQWHSGTGACPSANHPIATEPCSKCDSYCALAASLYEDLVGIKNFISTMSVVANNDVEVMSHWASGFYSLHKKVMLKEMTSQPQHVKGLHGGSWIVFEGPVSRLEKDCNWTGPRPEKTEPAVQSFHFWDLKTAKRPVFMDRSHWLSFYSPIFTL